MLFRLCRSTLVLVALVASPLTADGQEYRATMTGLISDAQGLVLPGVAVTATHVETGTTYQAVTEGTGAYTFALLPPGDYTVAALLEGFARLVREKVRLNSGQRVTLDLKLEVGSMTESVTVQGEAALLSTGTASVGVVVESAQLDNLPMSGRAPSSLIKLSAGVLDQTSPVANTRPFDNSGTSSFSMGGGQNRTNELLLDGGPNMAADRRISYNPPADIVQEIKIETFQSDASYGNSAAGTVNIVTKSGTNRFSGGAGYYTQPSSLSGTTYFTKRAGRTEPPFTYKQGGATAGGPLVIPGLIDGRNRVFWIVSYDNIQDSYVTPVTTTVPTAAMRNGDFSDLLRLGDVYRLYDPLTGVAEGARRRRQAFSDNRIPADRINSIAKAYLDYYPLPNQPGSADGTGNYLSPTTRSDTYYSLMGRTDININARNRLMVKWYGNDRTERKGNLFGNIGTGAVLPRLNSGAMGDYVHILNSTTTINSRFGWTRFSDHETRESTGFDMTSIGFPPSLAAESINPVLPLIAFSDTTSSLGPTGGNVAGAGFSSVFDSYQWFTSATSARGKHTFKYGADVRLLRETSINYGNSAGSYTFGTNWTRGPLDNAAGAPNGQAFASLLLGLPTAGQFDVNTDRDNNAFYTAFFFQDDWRPRSDLTINVGLRYERETGTVERYDRTLVGFDETSPNSATAAARAAYAANPQPGLPASEFNPAGGPIFASSSHRNVYSTPGDAFSPRFGVAYTPQALGGQTVFRGGFGIFYDTYGTMGVQQPGFSQSTPYVATLDGFLTPAATLSNPFPAGVLAPVNAARGLDQNIGQGLTYTNPILAQPYSRRYTAGVQHELGAGLVVEGAYAYSEFRDLPISLAQSYTPAQYLSASSVRDQDTINRLTANVPNPFQGLLPGTSLNGPTIAYEQLVRMFPQYTSLQVNTVNDGSSDQHMLSATAQKRFSRGMQVLATYTRSIMKESTSKLNPSDTGLERRIANEDRPNRFVLSGVYALPFGAGQRYGSGTPAWLRTVIGGWSVSGIYTYQSGSVLTWGNVIYLGGDLQWDPRNVERAFNIAAFNTNPAQQLDRNIRTLPSDFGELRLDTVNTLNVALVKNTTLAKATLQLRAETFNAFDRVQFSAPVTAPTTSNFGQITSQANAPRSVQFAARLMW
jgi:Carboxypeptidase regulatory-like domain